MRYHFGGDRLWLEVQERLNEKLIKEKEDYERDKFITRKMQQHENELIFKADFFNK